MHIREDVMINSVNSSDLSRASENRGPFAPETPLKTRSTVNNKPIDRVTLGNPSAQSATYGVSAGTHMNTSDYDSLRELIVKIFGEQDVTTQIASGEASIDLQDLTPAQAQDLVSADGYLGVAQTSDRIFQLSISLAGNDPEKLQAIKESVTKGFEMAKEALGGYLPEISMQTYDAVMEKLDAWAQDFEKS
jgi:hypothetical protein